MKVLIYDPEPTLLAIYPQLLNKVASPEIIVSKGEMKGFLGEIRKEEYDLILMDVKAGKKAADVLDALECPPDVIVLAGYNTGVFDDKEYLLSIIRKPFSSKNLIGELKNVTKIKEKKSIHNKKKFLEEC